MNKAESFHALSHLFETGSISKQLPYVAKDLAKARREQTLDEYPQEDRDKHREAYCVLLREAVEASNARAYNRDLSLRVRDGQVGSGMSHR